MLMMPCCHPCCKPTLLANQKAPASSVDDVLLEDPAHAAVALLAAHALRDTAAAAVAPVGMYARQIPRPSPSAARGHACSSVPGGPRSAGPPWRPSAQTPPLTTSTAVRLLWPAGAPPQRQGCLQGKPHMRRLYTSQGSANQLLALCIDMTTNSSGVGRSRTRV